jgi:Fe-S cluster biosynthesis and repair protein YggX
MRLFEEGSRGLTFAPYPGELGKRIYDNVSKEAFEMWKKHQTMLVNENRLNLADARARQYLARRWRISSSAMAPSSLPGMYRPPGLEYCSALQ